MVRHHAKHYTFFLERCTHITIAFFLARQIFPTRAVFHTFELPSKLYIFLFVCFVSANVPQGKFFGGIILCFTHKFKLNIFRRRVAAIASRIYIVYVCVLLASAPQGEIFWVFYLDAHISLTEHSP